MKNEPKDD